MWCLPIALKNHIYNPGSHGSRSCLPPSRYHVPCCPWIRMLPEVLPFLQFLKHWRSAQLQLAVLEFITWILLHHPDPCSPSVMNAVHFFLPHHSPIGLSTFIAPIKIRNLISIIFLWFNIIFYQGFMKVTDGYWAHYCAPVTNKVFGRYACWITESMNIEMNEKLCDPFFCYTFLQVYHYFFLLKWVNHFLSLFLCGFSISLSNELFINFHSIF